jgi:hypothetical protein
VTNLIPVYEADDKSLREVWVKSAMMVEFKGNVLAWFAAYTPKRECIRLPAPIPDIGAITDVTIIITSDPQLFGRVKVILT